MDWIRDLARYLKENPSDFISLLGVISSFFVGVVALWISYSPSRTRIRLLSILKSIEQEDNEIIQLPYIKLCNDSSKPIFIEQFTIEYLEKNYLDELRMINREYNQNIFHKAFFTIKYKYQLIRYKGFFVNYITEKLPDKLDEYSSLDLPIYQRITINLSLLDEISKTKNMLFLNRAIELARSAKTSDYQENIELIEGEIKKLDDTEDLVKQEFYEKHKVLIRVRLKLTNGKTYKMTRKELRNTNHLRSYYTKQE